MSEIVETKSPVAHNTTGTYRHTVPVRVTHWINVVVLAILLMSGFQIFNAHPALYWGDRSDRDRAILSMGSDTQSNGAPRGVTRIAGWEFDTTGVFGLSTDGDGKVSARGFPAWITVPGGGWLAMGRHWHLFFAWLFVANGLLYAIYALSSGHLTRDLVPQKRDWRGIGRSIVDHLRFRHPQGEAALRYNVLQKLAYVFVVFGLGPLAVLTGLAMSPWIDSLVPITDLFGGRQSARTLHFIAAFGFVGFVLIHIFMVLITGVWNNLRSMITGRYDIVDDGGKPDGQ